MATKTKDSLENSEQTNSSHELKNGDEEFVHRNPFEFMKIDDNKFLKSIDGRMPCPKCKKSRKFFCYTCYVPVHGLESRLPKVQLPVQIDIIKHHQEIDGKSTATHAAILAPEHVKIYTYPNIPDYSSDVDDGTVSKKMNFQ